MGIASTWSWVLQVFLVVLAALTVDFVQKRVVRRMHKRLTATDNPWDDALVEALSKPISLLIWVVGITFGAQIVARVSGAPIFAAVGPLRDVGVIVAITWFLIRLARGIQKNLVTRRQATGERVDQTSVDAIGRLVRASIIITATLVVMQTLGYSVSGVLAFGGVGGIAIGFAAKDLLSNFFGGLMLYMDRPFSVGDWVRSPDREIEGTVEEIGWRLTRIRTFDKRPIYIPNSAFASITVENPSRMSHRRIRETIGIRYADFSQMDAITAEVTDMLKNHPAIAADQTLMVHFNSFAPSSLDFFVYTFTKTTVWTEFHEIKQEILLKIGNIIESHGAEFAFPTTTLDLPEPMGPSAALAAPQT
jgi:MscS family membrane protein